MYRVSGAKKKRFLNSTLLFDISVIAGVSILDNSPNHLNLQQLGLDFDSASTVSKYLSQNANMYISNEDVPKLSIGRIRELEKTVGNCKISGLKVLFGYVDSDELEGTNDIVFVPTLTHNSAVRVDEFNTNETYLVLIPGFEGNHKKFHSLCERLKLPAAALQPGLDHPNESLTEMAARMAKTMLKKIRPKKKFYLLGHSFGVMVALEMAAILEDQGLEGVVYCVDASSDTFAATLDSLVSEARATDKTRLQDAIVQHMCALMAGDASECLHLELNDAQDWPNKVEAGMRALRVHVTHSSQYTRALIETAYARIEQARRYDAQRLREHPLRSLLVVLRTSCQPASAELDLGLKRYSLRAPVVYNLSKDHARALDDLRCANFINRHLDEDILGTFQKRNLCEAYLLNASSFMTDHYDDESEGAIIN